MWKTKHEETSQKTLETSFSVIFKIPIWSLFNLKFRELFQKEAAGLKKIRLKPKHLLTIFNKSIWILIIWNFFFLDMGNTLISLC